MADGTAPSELKSAQKHAGLIETKVLPMPRVLVDEICVQPISVAVLVC